MTDKFDPGSNVTPPTTNIQSNRIAAGVALRDSSGRLLRTIDLDQYGRGSYTRTIGEGDLGVNTWNSNFTGKPGTSGSFTQHIYDANGNLQGAAAASVDQLVAGPGIYLSSPNGLGQVTISNQPIPIVPNGTTLYSVVWSTNTSTNLTADGRFIPGQFTAVGSNGVCMRSRDGLNWVQMSNQTKTITGVSAEIDLSLPDNHLEYNGVGTANNSIYGRLGYTGTTATNTVDGMLAVDPLSDQGGLISSTMISTFIFTPGLGTGPVDNGPFWVTDTNASTVWIKSFDPGTQIYLVGKPIFVGANGAIVRARVDYPAGSGQSPAYFSANYDFGPFIPNGYNDFSLAIGYNYPWPGRYYVTVEIYQILGNGSTSDIPDTIYNNITYWNQL